MKASQLTKQAMSYTIDPKKLQRIEKINEHIEDHHQKIRLLEKEKRKIFEWFQSDFEEALSEVRNGYEDIISDLGMAHDQLLIRIK